MSRVGFRSGRGLAAVCTACSTRFWSPARRLKGLLRTRSEKLVSINAPEARQFGITKAAVRTEHRATTETARTARCWVAHDSRQRSPEATRHASQPAPATMKGQ